MRDRSTRLLYVSFRMPFPFFVGGDGLVAHFILEGSAKFFGCACLSLGVISPVVFPLTDQQIVTTLGHLQLPFDSLSDSDNSLTRVLYRLPFYSCRMVRPQNLLDDLRSQIRAFKPDIIITAEERCLEVIDVAHSLRIPVILRVNHAFWSEQELAAAGKKANLVVYVSNFIRDKYRGVVDGDVVYPIYDWDLWTVQEHSARYISMLNPVPEKGGDIFFRVLANLPQKEFLSQEGWYRPKVDPASYPNLTWRPRVLWDIGESMGMKYFLSNTRVLLAPSQCEDAMPGIVIQAMKNGVPVIGSRIGGIPEALEDAGVLVERYQEPDAWVQAIEALDGDPVARRVLSARARVASKRFSYEAELAGFHRLVDRCLGIR